MIGKTNAGGGGSTKKSVIIATAPTGSTVTCSNGEKTKTATEKNGEWRFNGIDNGTWTLKATLGSNEEIKIVEVTEFGVYRVNLAYQLFASDFDWDKFGVLGTDYEVVYDDDTPIPKEQWGTAKNWKVRMFISSLLDVKRTGKIDVLIFGGGSGGAGSNWDEGHSQNAGSAGNAGTFQELYDVTVDSGTSYAIEIGAGGNGSNGYTVLSNPGGTSKAFGYEAVGGDPVRGNSNGGISYNHQEFGTGKSYGGVAARGSAGTDNTADGGGGGVIAYNQNTNGRAGGSGIVVIRPAKEAA